MNADKPDNHITLYSIKLKNSENDDSDSDDGNKNGGMSARQAGFKFGFIREMRLNLNYSIIQAINT